MKFSGSRYKCSKNRITRSTGSLVESNVINEAHPTTVGRHGITLTSTATSRLKGRHSDQLCHMPLNLKIAMAMVMHKGLSLESIFCIYSRVPQMCLNSCLICASVDYRVIYSRYINTTICNQVRQLRNLGLRWHSNRHSKIEQLGCN